MNFFFLLLAFSLVKILVVECDELLFVQSVWRHGDRTPIGAWPKDPYDETFWSQNGFQGWEQLTQMGMEQHYELGKKLRERYITNLAFLSPTYKSQEIYIKSTDYNRTIISAYSNLMGMFEAGEENQTGIDYPQNPKWPKGFVPIAVHTGTIGPLYCKRGAELLQLLEKTPEFQNLLNNQTYQENVEKVKNLTRWENLDLTRVMDTLNIEYNVYNLSNIDPELVKMFSFLNQTVDNLIRWQNGWDVKPYQGIDFSIEIPKASNGGGSFVWNFLGLTNEKIRCKFNSTDSTDLCKWMNQLKYYAFSGHDITLEALFSTLGFRKSAYDEDGIPRYATGLTLELWLNTSSNNSYIKVLYWPLNKTYKDVTMSVTGCVENCPLEMFINRSMPYKVDDYEEWCNTPLFAATSTTATIVLVTSPNHPNSSSYVEFSIILSMFLLLFCDVREFL